MTDLDRDNLLLVGVCGPPHGVKGEVKVIPETDDPARLLGLERVWVGASAAEAVEFTVEATRFQQAKRGLVVLLRLAEVPHREAAEILRKRRVYAHAEDLPALEEGGTYLHDLPGLAVLVEDEEGATERVGVVADVMEGVAQDLLVIRREGFPDALVPDVPEIVIDVDLEGGTLTLRPPEGLLD